MAFASPLREHTSPFVQAKLTIGEPNDTYEQEADAVADQVMKMPSNSRSGIQRKCAKCEEEELQMKPLGPPIRPIVQKRSNAVGGNAPSNLSKPLSGSKGSGQPMPTATQQFMGNGFGTDFSHVKIHTDNRAVQMNRQLNAKAFTNGSDIYFNQGQYNPQSTAGKHLLAHELTHVVQQGNGTSKIVQRSCPQGKTRETGKPITNNDCSHSREANPENFITHLYLVPSGSNQATVVALWSGGSSNKWAATIRDSRTPQSLQTPDRVGTKCTEAHTNTAGDHMAYFTGLQREGKNIGFHNSQPVGAGHRSHGCIRVHCSTAKIINENTRSYDAATTLASTQIIYNPDSIPYRGSNVMVYVIQSGDTLSQIASDHNTTVNIIKELNDLPNDNIREGQRIFVPVT